MEDAPPELVQRSVLLTDVVVIRLVKCVESLPRGGSASCLVGTISIAQGLGGLLKIETAAWIM